MNYIQCAKYLLFLKRILRKIDKMVETFGKTKGLLECQAVTQRSIANHEKLLISYR